MRIETASGHTILADDADLLLLIEYSWWVKRTVSGRLYASALIRGTMRRISMHRLLMDPPARMVVHHRNNNGLDNRRANLEVTTQRQNIRYAYQDRPCVHPHKQTGKWRAQVRDEAGRQVSLGCHATREAALLAVAAYRSNPSPPVRRATGRTVANRTQCEWTKANGTRCKLYARSESVNGERVCNYHTLAGERHRSIAAAYRALRSEVKISPPPPSSTGAGEK